MELMEHAPMAKHQSHRGRPTTKATKGKKKTLGVRVTTEIFEKLDRAAKRNDRPLSQEAELRFERSFHDEELLPQLVEIAYGQHLGNILMVLGKVMVDTAAHAALTATPTAESAADWASNPWAYRQTMEAALHALEAMKPDGEPTPPEYIATLPEGRTKETLANLGRRLAAGALEALRNQDRGGAIGDWAKPIRKKLGAIATRIKVDDSQVAVSAMTPDPVSGRGRSAIALLSKEGQDRG